MNFLHAGEVWMPDLRSHESTAQDAQTVILVILAVLEFFGFIKFTEGDS